MRNFFTKLFTPLLAMMALLMLLPSVLQSAHLIPRWASMAATALYSLLLVPLGVWAFRRYAELSAMTAARRSLLAKLIPAMCGVVILIALPLYARAGLFRSVWVLLAVVAICWALFTPSGLWAARRIGQLRKS